MDAAEADRPLRDVSRAEVFKHFGIFTGLRLAMIAVIWALLYLIGIAFFPAGFAALLISLPISYFLLAGPRQNYVNAIVDRINWYKHQKAQLDADLAGESD